MGITKYNKGQFGLGINKDYPSWNVYGWYLEQNKGRHFVVKNKKALEDNKQILITLGRYYDDFIPCHEPLPLEPSFEEWAKFMFEQMPNVYFIETVNEASPEARIFRRKKSHVRSQCINTGKHFRPEDRLKSYKRADLFPPVGISPDWNSYIGCFGKFYDWGDRGKIRWGYLKEYKPKFICHFLMENGGHYAFFEPGLPSKHLTQTEAENV